MIDGERVDKEHFKDCTTAKLYSYNYLVNYINIISVVYYWNL